jgi:hypothetical protein
MRLNSSTWHTLIVRIEGGFFYLAEIAHIAEIMEVIFSVVKLYFVKNGKNMWRLRIDVTSIQFT